MAVVWRIFRNDSRMYQSASQDLERSFGEFNEAQDIQGQCRHVQEEARRERKMEGSMVHAMFNLDNSISSYCTKW